MSLLHIGKVRHFLFISGTHRWNGWIRDWTAWVELKFSWLMGALSFVIRPMRS